MSLKKVLTESGMSSSACCGRRRGDERWLIEILGKDCKSEFFIIQVYRGEEILTVLVPAPLIPEVASAGEGRRKGQTGLGRVLEKGRSRRIERLTGRVTTEERVP